MAGYRGRHFVRERVWVCGDYLEADIYPVFQTPGQRRKKCKPTREVQQKINQRDAERKLDRIVKANFAQDDLAVHLTFREAVDAEEAARCVKAYLRRVRRKYRKAGEELRYIYVIEHGKSGRTDAHCIVNRGPLSRDELEEAWGLGTANARRLQWDEDGVSAFVAYISKQGKRQKRKWATYRRWAGSRNLIRPEPIITDGELTITETMDLADAIERRDAENQAEELWPGYCLAEAEAVKNLYNQGTYIHVKLARRECWNGRPPRARYFSGQTGEDEP